MPKKTNRILLSMSVLLAFSCNVSFAQPKASSKNAYIFSNEMVAAISKGEHLDLAKELSLKQFVEYRLKYDALYDAKKFGIQKTVILYKDTAYTYFGRQHEYGLNKFFKVKSAEVDGLNYNKIDRSSLKEIFFEEIVPLSDKALVETAKKNSHRPGENVFTNKEAHYLPETGEIQLSYKWKAAYGVFNTINKTYTAKYNLRTEKMVN